MAQRKVKSAKHKSLVARVTAAVLKSAKPIDTDTLARRVKARADSVSSTCSRLVRRGAIFRVDGNVGKGGTALWFGKPTATKAATTR